MFKNAVPSEINFWDFFDANAHEGTLLKKQKPSPKPKIDSYLNLCDVTFTFSNNIDEQLDLIHKFSNKMQSTRVTATFIPRLRKLQHILCNPENTVIKEQTGKKSCVLLNVKYHWGYCYICQVEFLELSRDFTIGVTAYYDYDPWYLKSMSTPHYHSLPLVNKRITMICDLNERGGLFIHFDQLLVACIPVKKPRIGDCYIPFIYFSHGTCRLISESIITKSYETNNA
ncbi:rga6 [Acrasis kona]|uniref:Rga6 n=1 Tax=Acrasis kona TaxID=1008807 RepID=A0AAW2ZHZ1_9EUKA